MEELNMDRRKEVDLKQKKLHSFLVALGYVFLGSSEQMVILPSVWSYIQNLSGEPQSYWIGLTISGTLSGLFFGWLSEKFKFRTKAILIGCLLFKISGNFQYMLGISVWNVVCGRLLQGIGSGAGTVLLAEFARVTNSKERTTFLSIFNATFQIGMIFGPVIQILVFYLDFEIFGITLNALNGPGLVWTILWSLFLLKALFFFSNLTEDFNQINEPRNSQTEISLKSIVVNFGDRKEQESLGSSGRRSSTRDDLFRSNNKHKRDLPSNCKSHSTLLLMVFVAFFCQGALETMVTVVTEEYFGFGVRENALVFEFMAMEALLVFFGVAFLGKFVRETTLQITGWVNLVLALVVLIHLMSKIEHENKIHMVSFLAALFISVLGIQILSAASIILSSKAISVDTHGPGKGTRHIMCFLGLILGPNWTGATIQMPILLLGFLLAIILFTGIMFLASSGKLKEFEDKGLDETEGVIQRGTSHDESATLLK